MSLLKIYTGHRRVTGDINFCLQRDRKFVDIPIVVRRIKIQFPTAMRHPLVEDSRSSREILKAFGISSKAIRSSSRLKYPSYHRE